MDLSISEKLVFAGFVSCNIVSSSILIKEQQFSCGDDAAIAVFVIQIG